MRVASVSVFSSVSFLTLVFLVAQLFVIVRLLWHCQLSPRACARARVLQCAPGWVVCLCICCNISVSL